MLLMLIHYYLQMITKALLEFNKFWKYNIYWVLWLLLISYLSNKPSSELPKISLLAFEHADKLVHAVFYFTLCTLCVYGFKRQQVFQKLQTSAVSISFFFSVIWGTLMEITQLTIFTYRSAEWADFFANTFAALFAILVQRILKRHKK